MRTWLWILSVVVIASVVMGIPYAALVTTAESGIPSWKPLLNSSMIALFATCTALVIGTVSALAAAQFRRRTVIALDLLFLFQLTIPHFVIGAGWRTILGRTGASSWSGFLCQNCSFTGLVPLLFTYTMAFAPLAYFGQRTALRSVSATEVDAARVAGLYGWRLFTTVYWQRLVLVAPALFAFIFSAIISDPVTPNIISPRIPVTATDVWFSSNAFGDKNLEATMALLLNIPVVLVVLSVACFYAYLLRRSPALTQLLRINSPQRSSSQQPVGSSARMPTTTVVLVGSVALLFISILAFRGFAADPATPISSAIINTMGLAFLVLLCSLVLSAIALGTRRSCGNRWGLLGRRGVDVVFALMALSPGASIGCGLRIAANQPGIHSAWSSLWFIVLACLPSSLAMTYFLMVYIGPFVSRSEFLVSLLQGVGPLRAVTSTVLPRSTNVLIIGFLTIFSNASVLAVPLLWVSSPDLPLIMLRLFTLLDAAKYSAAFQISMTVSIVIVSIAGAILVGINGIGLSFSTKRRNLSWL